MTPSQQETAYAKINLALHVRGRRADGYHTIETLFAFADEGDRLSAEEDAELSLGVTGPFGDLLAGDGNDNLVLRAARAMADRFAPGRGASILLDKRLPVASGIGGGSADAAAAIRLLDRLWGLGRPLTDYEPLAADLGADVPACLHSRSAIGRGTGTALEFVDIAGLADRHLLLINPGVAVSTADIFRRWDGHDHGPLPRPVLETLFEEGRNDLESPARAIVPEIEALLAALRKASPFVRMSGSGATCFALFEERRDAVIAAVGLRVRFPAAWIATMQMHRAPCAAAPSPPQAVPS